MSIRKGMAVVFGVHPEKRIVNVPDDALKVRVRMRAGEFARAFVKFPDRVEQWILMPANGHLNCPEWRLGILQGRNTKGIAMRLGEISVPADL